MRRRMQPRMPGGYTLVEMLVVMAIIAVLGGMIMGGIMMARKGAKNQQSQVTLTLIRATIDRYNTDFHDEPPSSGGDDPIGGSECLLQALRTDEKNGPYIKLDEIKTCDENGNGIPEIADAFGHAIRYLHRRDYKKTKPNRDTFRLWSIGADGKDDPYNPSSDDLVNWDKNKGE